MFNRYRYWLENRPFGNFSYQKKFLPGIMNRDYIQRKRDIFVPYKKHGIVRDENVSTEYGENEREKIKAVKTSKVSRSNHRISRYRKHPEKPTSSYKHKKTSEFSSSYF